MTDQELIALLRDLGDHAAFEPHMHHKAADRIEELECDYKDACNEAANCYIKQCVAEAKLAKAVEALRETAQMLSQCTFTIIRMKGQYFDRQEVVDKAHAVLAELEGKE